MIIEDKEASFSRLMEKVHSCERCPRMKGRTGIVKL